MELRFDAILYSKLGNETSDAGHIKFSRGPQVPHPCSRPNRDLFDDETTVYVDMVFTKLRNMKTLLLDAYRTKNNLPKQQRDSLRKLFKPLTSRTGHFFDPSLQIFATP